MEAQRPGAHPTTYDIPLPGNYPCLTLQLNITRYQATGAYRAVLVTREPSSHIEVQRMADDGYLDTPTSRDILTAMVRGSIGTLMYLQGAWND